MVSAAAQSSPRDPLAEKRVWQLMEDVPDPEVPVLSVHDLGVVRSVEVDGAGSVSLGVTPTYVGCPATAAINMAIRSRLLDAGYADITIKTVLSPAWTTDWITQEGRQKLKEYGIAPPVGTAEEAARGRATLFGADPTVPCPHCGSTRTEKVSEFGSTACKAHYKCSDCLEPFDYFKCI